ncbi:alpha/beta fold hydrolase [Clostridium taeniosporum]|uniref:alpha/beta fold hydrolase n=1 Tax=Clostridium taeniosporum TaxID=394958 RepID=UPI000F742520|nr:alpha/beta hydrolase [Clostridium taeniosporum]
MKILTNADDDYAWNNSQAALKEWSTNSEQILVHGAGHAIYHTKPDVINNEILKLIEN